MDEEKKKKLLAPYGSSQKFAALGTPHCLFCNREYLSIKRTDHATNTIADVWEADCFCRNAPVLGDLLQMEARLLEAIKELKK